MKNTYLKYVFKTFALVLALILPNILSAQEERKLTPVSRTYAFTQVNIVQAPGRKIEMGTIIYQRRPDQCRGKKSCYPCRCYYCQSGQYVCICWIY